MAKLSNCLIVKIIMIARLVGDVFLFFTYTVDI